MVWLVELYFNAFDIIHVLVDDQVVARYLHDTLASLYISGEHAPVEDPHSCFVLLGSDFIGLADRKSVV